MPTFRILEEEEATPKRFELKEPSEEKQFRLIEDTQPTFVPVEGELSYNIVDKDDIDWEAEKEGFKETLKGYGRLAKQPMGIVEGAMQFVSSLPGFGVGILNATAKIIEDIGVGRSSNLSELYQTASDGFLEGSEAMSFLEYQPKIQEAELVGATAMAPAQGIAMAGHMLADTNVFEGYPNIQGALRFSGDIGGLLAMGRIIKGPKRQQFSKVVSEQALKAAEIAERQKALDALPKSPLKELRQKELAIEKQKLEVETAKLNELMNQEAQKFQVDLQELRAKRAQRKGKKEPTKEQPIPERGNELVNQLAMQKKRMEGRALVETTKTEQELFDMRNRANRTQPKEPMQKTSTVPEDVSKTLIKEDLKLESKPELAEQYADAVAKERVKQARKVHAKLSGFEIAESAFDKASGAFIETGDFNAYLKAIPDIGDLTPQQVGRLTEGAFAKIKGGKSQKYAIRKSGFYALEKFRKGFEGKKDVPKIDLFAIDPTRGIQRIDGGRFGGLAQKFILWPTRRATIARLQWQDAQKKRFHNVLETHNVKSAKDARAVGHVLEFIGTEDVAISPKKLLQNPEISAGIKSRLGQRRLNKKANDIVRAAQETRKLLDEWRDAQNQMRGKRKQDLIPKIEKYRTWVIERNLVSRVFGFAMRPREVMEKPVPPDFIQPNQPPNPRAMKRSGLLRKYRKEENIIKLVPDYIDTAGRDIFDTNIIHNNKIHAKVLRDVGMPNAAEFIENWTAEAYAGVPHRVTRAVQLIPEPLSYSVDFLKLVRRNLTRAVFPLNWTWNMFVQTSSAGLTVARHGLKNSIKGLRVFVDKDLSQAIDKNCYSYILKKRWGGSPVYQDLAQGIDKMRSLQATRIETIEHYMNWMTRTFEDVLTKHAIASAFFDGKTRLRLEGRALWEYASDGGAKTQSMYNHADLVGPLRAKEVGVVAPFQTFCFEVLNTVREMDFPVIRKLGKAGEYQTLLMKSPEGKALMSRRLKILGRWFVAMQVSNAIAEKAMGRKPWQPSSFVPFFAIMTGMGYQRPLPIQYREDLKRGIRNVIEYENPNELISWATRYHVPAGLQINRMMEGAQAVWDGAVTDVTGREKFKIKGTSEKVKAVAMGPYKTEAGREYFKSKKEKKKGKKETSLGF